MVVIIKLDIKKWAKVGFVWRLETKKVVKGTKAKNTAAQVKKGKHIKKSHKVWNKATFRRPTTLKVARKPLYERKASRKVVTWDKYSVIVNPLTTESAIKTIEDTNTLVFVVD